MAFYLFLFSLLVRRRTTVFRGERIRISRTGKLLERAARLTPRKHLSRNWKCFYTDCGESFFFTPNAGRQRVEYNRRRVKHGGEKPGGRPVTTTFSRVPAITVLNVRWPFRGKGRFGGQSACKRRARESRFVRRNDYFYHRRGSRRGRSASTGETIVLNSGNRGSCRRRYGARDNHSLQPKRVYCVS